MLYKWLKIYVLDISCGTIRIFTYRHFLRLKHAPLCVGCFSDSKVITGEFRTSSQLHAEKHMATVYDFNQMVIYLARKSLQKTPRIEARLRRNTNVNGDLVLVG